MKKVVVVGIIVLFIGVGVQPSFANEVSITAISNNEDDCNCEPISNLHLVIREILSNKLDRLLNRLEVYTGIILILYRYNPDVTEKFEELSNEIITFKEINNALKLNVEFGLRDEFCDALDYYIDLLDGYIDELNILMAENPELIPILYLIRLTLKMYYYPLLIIWFMVCRELYPM
jgi:hypothetical protein